METKPLLYGLMGFFIGGLLVSIAATTFDKPDNVPSNDSMSHVLQGKTGDAYDKAYLEAMIIHHEGAVLMSKQSANNAKHQEIKDLSNSITKAQENEIKIMKQWQNEWGYTDSSQQHMNSSH